MDSDVANDEGDTKRPMIKTSPEVTLESYYVPMKCLEWISKIMAYRDRFIVVYALSFYSTFLV